MKMLALGKQSKMKVDRVRCDNFSRQLSRTNQKALSSATYPNFSSSEDVRRSDGEKYVNLSIKCIDCNA